MHIYLKIPKVSIQQKRTYRLSPIFQSCDITTTGCKRIRTTWHVSWFT